MACNVVNHRSADAPIDREPRPCPSNSPAAAADPAPNTSPGRLGSPRTPARHARSVAPPPATPSPAASRRRARTSSETSDAQRWPRRLHQSQPGPGSARRLWRSALANRHNTQDRGLCGCPAHSGVSRLHGHLGGLGGATPLPRFRTRTHAPCSQASLAVGPTVQGLPELVSVHERAHRHQPRKNQNGAAR